MFEGEATFLRDPVTVSDRERIDHYQLQAERYRQMAAAEERSFIREGLLALAHQCAAMGEALELVSRSEKRI